MMVPAHSEQFVKLLLMRLLYFTRATVQERDSGVGDGLLGVIIHTISYSLNGLCGYIFEPTKI